MNSSTIKIDILVCSHCQQPCVDENCRMYWYDNVFCTLNCVSNYRKALNEKCANCHSNIENDEKIIFLQSDEKKLSFCADNCVESYKEKNHLCQFCFASDSQYWNERNKHCSFECYQILNRMKVINSMRHCYSCYTRKSIKEVSWLGGSDLFYLCSDICLKRFQIGNGHLKKCFQCKINYPIEFNASIVISKANEKLTFCSKQCINHFVVNSKESARCIGCGSDGKYWQMFRNQYLSVWCSLRCMKGESDPISVKRLKKTEGKKQIFFEWILCILIIFKLEFSSQKTMR